MSTTTFTATMHVTHGEGIVKTVRTWIFLGGAIAGLLCGHASLRAQPAGAPVPVDDDPVVIDGPDKPWSQGIPIASRSAARELFLEGNRLFWIPLFARAAEHYTAALARWKHPAFYFNLALAQINLGHEVEAKDSLERALAHGEEPLGAKAFQEGRKRLQEVKRQLGRIRVICRTPGAEVTLDGAMLFVGPGSHEGWVKARPHELTAKKTGYQSEARRVTVSAGKILEVDLSLVTLTQAADASRRWAAWKPWAVAAAGGVVMAAGGGFHALAFRNFNAHDLKFQGLACADPQGGVLPGCPRSDPELTTLNRLLKRARLQQEIAVGSYVAGASLIAAGVGLLYMNRPRLAEHGVAGPSSRHMTIIPAGSSDELGVIVRVSY